MKSLGANAGHPIHPEFFIRWYRQRTLSATPAPTFLRIRSPFALSNEWRVASNSIAIAAWGWSGASELGPWGA